VATSVSGSLLLCDVEMLRKRIDDEGEEDDINHRSCRIVLPFMNGLDSEDDVDLGEGARLRVRFDWDSSDDCEEQMFDVENLLRREGIPGPLEDEDLSSHDSVEYDAFEVNRRASGHSKQNFEGTLKTPSGGGMQTIPNLIDDIWDKIPISLPNLDNYGSGESHMPALTPLKEKGSASAFEKVVPKESPNCVMEIPEEIEDAASGITNFGFSNGDFLSVQLCTELLSDVDISNI
jgi:hypothetical protein